jgi:hypothetical protein
VKPRADKSLCVFMLGRGVAMVNMLDMRQIRAMNWSKETWNAAVKLWWEWEDYVTQFEKARFYDIKIFGVGIFSVIANRA